MIFSYRRGARRTPPGAGVVQVAMVAVLAMTSLIAVAKPAFAYVRYRSDTQCPYAWRTRSIPIQAFPQGLPDMTTDEIANAMVLAASAWTARDPILAGCTNLDLPVTVHTMSQALPAAKFDHANNILVRVDTWCPRNAAGTAPDCSIPYDPSALAITSVFAKGYGQIVDADIEVNAANFNWGDLENIARKNGQQDLQNALTHELGHLIGLDHTCNTDPTRPAPLDQNGNAIPDCGDAPNGVRITTMFASADPGDVSKRTLEPDDQQAVCDTYPLVGADPLECPPPDSGYCAIAPADETPPTGSDGFPRRRWGVFAAAVASGAVVFGVRRRARRRPPV